MCRRSIARRYRVSAWAWAVTEHMFSGRVVVRRWPRYGCYRVSRAHDEIRRRRSEQGSDDLLDQVLWRIKILGGDVDLVEPENRDAFSDVLGEFAPGGYGLLLNPSDYSRATDERGGYIRFSGYLVTGGVAAAELERRLYLGERYADHRRIRVAPRFRGNRIAPRSLIRCVRLYDALGIEHVVVRACFSGTWYWAQWGFRFSDDADLARMQEHTQRIIEGFGGGVDASLLTHPQQFLTLGEPEDKPGEPAMITFDQLCDAVPPCRDAWEDIASDNGLGMHDPIPFGRAVLLTGPSWHGRLTLTGADRLIFDDRARRVLAALEEGTPNGDR